MTTLINNLNVRSSPMFRNLRSFNLPSVSSQYGETKVIKINKNATAANVVATRPVLDFLVDIFLRGYKLKVRDFSDITVRETYLF
jgi:hypothetical protein